MVTLEGRGKRYGIGKKTINRDPECIEALWNTENKTTFGIWKIRTENQKWQTDNAE